MDLEVRREVSFSFAIDHLVEVFVVEMALGWNWHATGYVFDCLVKRAR